MKKILIATAAFALLGAPAAFAQERHHDEHGAEGGHAYQGPSNHGGPAPQAQGRYQGPPGPQAQGHFQGGPGPQSQGRYQGGPQMEGRPGYAPSYRPGNNREAYGPGGYRPGDRADRRGWGNFQRNVYAQRRFSFGGYVRPPGWYYHRWSFGEFLPGFFWTHNYWINDYGYFGLPYPPPGCIWVRYGDDALLIDRYNGQIVQVVYGLFY
jgi:Ni/Co efflux regulator RcnB